MDYHGDDYKRVSVSIKRYDELVARIAQLEEALEGQEKIRKAELKYSGALLEHTSQQLEEQKTRTALLEQALIQANAILLNGSLADLNQWMESTWQNVIETIPRQKEKGRRWWQLRRKDIERHGEDANRPGFIYLMSGQDSGLFKIGLSSHPKRRKTQVQKDAGEKVDLMHVIPSTNMPRDEAWLHEVFSDKRIRGEWFDLNNEDINDICSIDSFGVNGATNVGEILKRNLSRANGEDG